MTIDLAGVCTGPGPCDTKIIGTGPNWVSRVGGLPAYVRAIAHAQLRKGVPESQAIRLAVGIIQRWARGEGNVTPATRVRAAAALAEWERKRAQARTTKLAEEARMTIDLASPDIAARMMPDEAAVRRMIPKIAKLPAGLQGRMRSMTLARARALGIKLDLAAKRAGIELAQSLDEPMRMTVNTTVTNPAQLNKASRAKLASVGKALPDAAAGGRFPIRSKADLDKAIRAVGRAKTAHASIRVYIMRRAEALGAKDRIPDTWAADGTLKAAS